FVFASIWELSHHAKEGKFINVSATHFIILSWVIPEIFMLALFCAGAIADIMKSSDSFAGAGLLLAPFYFLALAILNSGLYLFRMRNANFIFLAGLVVPIFLFLIFSIYRFSTK